MNDYKKAAQLIVDAKYIIAFKGAGISVESGIPPFRGEKGLWNKYNPNILTLSYFRKYPEVSWPVIKTIFYEFFSNAKPNTAHLFLADLEKKGNLKAVITQNIDGLHQLAGSINVLEFHGTAQTISCTSCHSMYLPADIDLSAKPPLCSKCGKLLKPDFVFFEEQINPDVHNACFAHAELADLVIIIGAGGEVVPAAYIPYEAKKRGAKIIEINTEVSSFTKNITDVFLEGKAVEITTKLMQY